MKHIMLPPNEIVQGDKIVTKFKRDGSIQTTRKVEKVGICQGQWRTHVHIDGECYDTRFSLIPVVRN